VETDENVVHRQDSPELSRHFVTIRHGLAAARHIGLIRNDDQHETTPLQLF